MIAYHFPPLVGGSGILRTLKFSHYLPRFNWKPIVLTIHKRAYSTTGSDQLSEIPSEVRVFRAFGLDANRHLSIRGFYPRLLALPDRWASWWVGAVYRGLQIIKKLKPEVIWVTYPIATAHLIGLSLHRLTKVPLVADFRDAMTEEEYPRDYWSWHCYRWIEKKIIRYSTQMVFTADLTREIYLDRYKDLDPSRCHVISNGYDERDFDGFKNISQSVCIPGSLVRLLHAGVVYPKERNPLPFFNALAKLKKEGIINSRALRIELRGAGTEDKYISYLRELDLEDIVVFSPSLPYLESLEDCMKAQGLLLMQYRGCNHQIPAKTYEYLRMGKPILALTDCEGETAKLLDYCEGATILNIADSQQIHEGFPKFLKHIQEGTHPKPIFPRVSHFSRESQSEQLAKCLELAVKKNEENAAS